MPLESFRGSQAPCRAACGTCGFFQTIHGGVTAPSCCAFTHRFAFEELSGHRILIKSVPGNRGRLACGTIHVASLEFPRQTGIILRCAGKAGNPFQTKQGNRLSCRDQEGRRGSDDVVPGPSVFPSREPGVSGNFWGRIKGGMYSFALQDRTWVFPGDAVAGNGLILRRRWNHVVFLELRRDSRVTKGISGFLFYWPWEAQSSIRVARESWGLRWSHCRAKETSSRRVCRTEYSSQGKTVISGLNSRLIRESGLVSRGSKGLRSLLESRRGSLGAP